MLIRGVIGKIMAALGEFLRVKQALLCLVCDEIGSRLGVINIVGSR
jgi:hypothetical protein